ncbi:MAG TPA: phospholipase [Polyangia bacterium]|nr:phospholipase [Polyangia bacterium]
MRQGLKDLALVVVALSAPALAATGAGTGSAAPLTTLVRGGKGPPTLLLLQGYGAKAKDWLPFTRTIELPRRARFVFPEAPEHTSPPDGPVGGRAWWRLDLEDHVPKGARLPDLSATHPPGLDEAAARVRALMHRAPKGPLVLGGFSQGAMVASDIAFTTDEPIAALVILSGTPVDEATWLRGLAKRRGLRVFISHGRADPTLPFASADRLRKELAAAGLDVPWFPFDGVHEIPTEVVVALNKFLAPIVGTPQIVTK